MSTMHADLEMVTWLRQQIEARRDLALRITAPRPHLRDSGARLSGEWQTGCTCKAECRDYPSCDEVTGDGIHIYSEGGHDSDQAAHIAANDPRDTIARCEMELAVLDAHYILHREDRSEEYEEFSVVSIGGADKNHGCVTCHYYGQGGVKGYGVCYTVRRMALGYRHWPGWKEEWGA